MIRMWQGKGRELMGKLVRNYGHKTHSFMSVFEDNWHPRQRAEILLDQDARGEIAVTPEEGEQLNRICIAPNNEDELWLCRFDGRLEALRASTTFTNEELSACAEREAEQRLSVYSDLIDQRQMREEEARRELCMMERIAEHFSGLAFSEAIAPAPAAKQKSPGEDVDWNKLTMAEKIAVLRERRRDAILEDVYAARNVSRNLLNWFAKDWDQADRVRIAAAVRQIGLVLDDLRTGWPEAEERWLMKCEERGCGGVIR
jgi:hypothetical protein